MPKVHLEYVWKFVVDPRAQKLRPYDHIQNKLMESYYLGFTGIL